MSEPTDNPVIDLPPASPWDGLAHFRSVRRDILDYSLFAALMGLLPLPGPRWPQLIVGLLFVGWMLLDLRRTWGRPKGLEARAVLGLAISVLSGIGVTAVVALALLAASTAWPILKGFEVSAVLAALCLSLGTALNHYYLTKQSLDLEAIEHATRARDERWGSWARRSRLRGTP